MLKNYHALRAAVASTYRRSDLERAIAVWYASVGDECPEVRRETEQGSPAGSGPYGAVPRSAGVAVSKSQVR